jgi:RNA polymerase sigma factor (sigma-70 family)
LTSPASGLAALLTAACGGDEAAVVSLTTRYTSLVRASAMRITTNHEDLADITQQTWLIFLQRMDSIRTAEALPGWLATTARREALRVVRERRRTLSLDDTADRIEDPAETPADQVVRRDVADRVQQALARLPRHRADLLLQVVGEPRPYREIAEDLGYRVGSLGPLRARYLTHLSAELVSCGITAA